MQRVCGREGYRYRWGELEVRSLTPRERQVLGLVSEGRRDQEIGERLGISPHTVRIHLTSIFDKLGVNRRTEAVAAFCRRDRLEARAS